MKWTLRKEDADKLPIHFTEMMVATSQRIATYFAFFWIVGLRKDNDHTELMHELTSKLDDPFSYIHQRKCLAPQCQLSPRTHTQINDHNDG